ncbi:Na+/H+ antiporter NhaA [Rhizobium binae]|uniref:Na+/H+ antiporter NhaA n=1 Tax=Rhizobium binae TaxID=1138190 RepID=UPI0035C8DDD7
MPDGQFSTWRRRVLPSAAAAGGILAPALIFVAFRHEAFPLSTAIPPRNSRLFVHCPSRISADRLPLSVSSPMSLVLRRLS